MTESPGRDFSDFTRITPFVGMLVCGNRSNFSKFNKVNDLSHLKKGDLFNFAKLNQFPSNKKMENTLPETNIAPETRPSQKETSLPIIHFQGLLLLVSGRVTNESVMKVNPLDLGIYPFLHHFL